MFNDLIEFAYFSIDLNDLELAKSFESIDALHVNIMSIDFRPFSIFQWNPIHFTHLFETKVCDPYMF